MKNTAARILLVDDYASLLRSLSIRLESQGYCIETVHDGRNALTVIARFAPSLVITDLRMDGMDGAALLDEIQTRWPGLAVLLMTAHGTIPDAVLTRQRGAFGFSTKPLDKHELRSHIERAIAVYSGSRPSDEWRRDFIGNS
jgi:two-component system, NtrC family, response regulator GlrR